MSFEIRPFGFNYVSGMTGGRFADWLERAGIEASADLAKENLKKAFGSDITKHVVRHLVTAWRGDPWVKGAYSAARPGTVGQRARLADAIDRRLFFAGEATSNEFFATAHGGLSHRDQGRPRGPRRHWGHRLIGSPAAAIPSLDNNHSFHEADRPAG